MDKTKHSIIKRVAFVGNYLPRQCGMATFTTDLCEALADEYKGTACIALPVNDTETGYEYPAGVRFELIEKDIGSYRRAFEWFLGRNDLHFPVYDPTTGGCRDGLHSDRPNENQGAESSLAFLQSLLELRLAENVGQPNQHN